MLHNDNYYFFYFYMKLYTLQITNISEFKMNFPSPILFRYSESPRKIKYKQKHAVVFYKM